MPGLHLWRLPRVCDVIGSAAASVIRRRLAGASSGSQSQWSPDATSCSRCNRHADPVSDTDTLMNIDLRVNIHREICREHRL